MTTPEKCDPELIQEQLEMELTKSQDKSRLYYDWYITEQASLKRANERIDMLEGLIKLLLNKEKQ